MALDAEGSELLVVSERSEVAFSLSWFNLETREMRPEMTVPREKHGDHDYVAETFGGTTLVTGSGRNIECTYFRVPMLLTFQSMELVDVTYGPRGEPIVMVRQKAHDYLERASEAVSIKSGTAEWDVFICHAGEDKQEVARPLAELLKKEGLRVWYDEFELKIGDFLRRRIDEGLVNSRYGVAILSPAFFAKDWPQKELDGLVALESGPNKRILPVWHKVDQEYVARYSPLLADRVAESTEKGLDIVMQKILQVVRPAIEDGGKSPLPARRVPRQKPPPADLHELHKQNISGTSHPKKASRLAIIIGPWDAPLTLMMSEGLDQTFQGLVSTEFNNLSKREPRRNSKEIRFYLAQRFRPSHRPRLTVMEEGRDAFISFDSQGILLFTDYIHRVDDLGFSVVARSLEDLAQDLYRVFTIAESLYTVEANYDGPSYVGLSLTNLNHAALTGSTLTFLPQPPAEIATWHMEAELSPGSTKGTVIFRALSSLLRDLQYASTEQPVKHALETLGINFEYN